MSKRETELKGWMKEAVLSEKKERMIIVLILAFNVVYLKNTCTIMNASF